MLNTVIFRSLKPDVYPDLTIPVIDPSPGQPLFLRDITGIEPVPATINSKGYGGFDGEFYVGSQLGKRNIVMKFGLNTTGGASSVNTARNLCYGYMMTKSQVLLQFITDDHVPVQIAGIVETLTPDRFSEDPAMQVSIICPKPNFVTPDIKLIRGNSSIDPVEVEIPYYGTLATGISFVLDMGNSNYEGEVILETRIAEPVYQTLHMYEVTYSSVWQLWINTEQGTKSIDIRTSPTDIVKNILGKMDTDSWWMFLVPGLNRFRVRTPSSNTPRGWSLSYIEQYGGI